VRTSIKFSSADLGLIHGAIHYENNAGVEQAYLLTKEIHIDMMDFIVPSEISLTEFRRKWVKYEWENRISINTTMGHASEFVNHIARAFKLKEVTHHQVNSEAFVSTNLYARTKMGMHQYIYITTIDDDFLINISADLQDGKINGFIRIRSKVKGIVVNLGDRIK
jgi:coatomer subunit beta